MKKFSFLIRLVILILSLILCISLIIGIFTRANVVSLKAKLTNQKVVLSIEDEAKALSPTDSGVKSSSEEKDLLSSTDIKDKKIVSIVVTNMGLSKAITDKGFELPSGVTFGFSPYTVNLDELLKKSLEEGHKSLIYIPLETKNYPQSDPGPLGLLTSLSNLENFQRFQTILESYNGYAGIYTSDDEIFSDSNNRMQPLIQYLKNNKLLYMYAGPAENQALHQLATQMSFPLINVDVMLDQEITEESIRAQLALLEKIVVKQGYGVGYANAYSITMDILNEWLPTLEKKDIYLVPITILNKKNNNF